MTSPSTLNTNRRNASTFVLKSIYNWRQSKETIFTTVNEVSLAYHSALCSFALLKKSRRNHRCYVGTEVLSSTVFVPAQKLSGTVWTQPHTVFTLYLRLCSEYIGSLLRILNTYLEEAHKVLQFKIWSSLYLPFIPVWERESLPSKKTKERAKIHLLLFCFVVSLHDTLLTFITHRTSRIYNRQIEGRIKR